MKSEKSVAESQIEEQMNSMIKTKNQTHLTIADANELIFRAGKILQKCEELRKSRDGWRNKYEELKNENT